MRTKYMVLFVSIFLLVGLTGCASLGKPTIGPAKVIDKPLAYKELSKLPKPSHKIFVAVYDFPDYTGQYKASINGETNFSTAVTQGAHSYVMEAARDSGWFQILDRKSLSNQISERKIIHNTRQNTNWAQSQGYPEGRPLVKPFRYADLLIEGGIIAYETNLDGGGIGAAYEGVSADFQGRKDQVTINLRLVSIYGEVHKSITTTKSILSTSVNFGLFKFVSVKSLLEIEAGYTYNEPPQMCVREAIYTAFTEMLIQGILEGLFKVENPKGALENPVIQKYIEEHGLPTEYLIDQNGYIQPQA